MTGRGRAAPVLVFAISVGCFGAPASAQTYLSGQLLGADNGVPVSCSVAELRADSGQIRIALTDPAGLYAFADVAGGMHRLTVHAPGYRRQSVPFFVAPGTIRLDFLLSEETSEASIRGEVVNARNGTPVPGAWVEVHAGPTPLDYTYACGEGVFEAVLPDDPLPSSVTVRVTAEDADTAVTEVPLPADAPIQFQLVFRAESAKECRVFGCGARDESDEDGAAHGNSVLLLMIAAATLSIGASPASGCHRQVVMRR